jgi:prevent-host-death family protein
MKHVALMDLRHHLGTVVDEVRIKSEPVILERSGRPVAMLCPIDYVSAQRDNHEYRERALNSLDGQGRKHARSKNLVAWLSTIRGGRIS